jgi:hypothetical protein
MSNFNLGVSIFAIPTQGEGDNLVADLAQHVKTVESFDVITGADRNRGSLGRLCS